MVWFEPELSRRDNISIGMIKNNIRPRRGRTFADDCLCYKYTIRWIDLPASILSFAFFTTLHIFLHPLIIRVSVFFDELVGFAFVAFFARCGFG